MIKWNTIASEPKTSRNVPVNDPEVEERVILEADVSGYPVEFSVSYSGQNALFDSAWREEKIRPESPVAKDIQNEVSEVILDVTVDEQGQITITDLKVWPDSTSVSVDI